MTDDLRRYLVDPGPKPSPTGLRAAVSTDSAIVTETMVERAAARGQRRGRGGGRRHGPGRGGAVHDQPRRPHLVPLLRGRDRPRPPARRQRHVPVGAGAVQAGAGRHRPVRRGSALGRHPRFHAGAQGESTGASARCPGPSCARTPCVWAERGHAVSTFEYGVYVFADRFITYFPESREFFQPDGRFPNVGETMVPRGLAETLRGVAEQGPDYMITGPWARAVRRQGERDGLGDPRGADDGDAAALGRAAPVPAPRRGDRRPGSAAGAGPVHRRRPRRAEAPGRPRRRTVLGRARLDDGPRAPPGHPALGVRAGRRDLRRTPRRGARRRVPRPPREDDPRRRDPRWT